jgi:hypothetical protein
MLFDLNKNPFVNCAYQDQISLQYITDLDYTTLTLHCLPRWELEEVLPDRLENGRYRFDSDLNPDLFERDKRLWYIKLNTAILGYSDYSLILKGKYIDPKLGSAEYELVRAHVTFKKGVLL